MFGMRISWKWKRRRGTVFAAAAAGGVAQPAPEPHRLCWRGAPLTSCRIVILTSVGGYGIAGSRIVGPAVDATGQPIEPDRKIGVKWRATVDYGLLFNLTKRDAIGASIMGSGKSTQGGENTELDGFLRYRRWFGTRRSLDLAVGVPVKTQNSDVYRSPYGLVQFNLDPTIGIALRPEIRRTRGYTHLPSTRTVLYLSAGVEIGQKPGFAMSVLGGIIAGIVYLTTVGRTDSRARR